MRTTNTGSMKENGGGMSKSTLFVFLWAFLTLWWSIFTPPHKTFAVRVLLLQPLWIFRAYVQKLDWLQDLVLTLFITTALNIWSGEWRPLTWLDVRSIDFGNRNLQLYAQIFMLLGLCCALAGSIVRREESVVEWPRAKRHSRESSIDEQLLPALLIPSRTSHTRIFPQKHSFSYSYLFVGIPVGVTSRISSALAVDCDTRAWFNVDSADYLERGKSHLKLEDKLKDYLHTQGVGDRDYSFAYFVTAPRFLGYSFNPVSFWYLYDTNADLKYIILEVNNTFDERRMYFLRVTVAEKVDEELKQTPNNLGTPGKATVYAEAWEKDFHVSPFNSRKGSYSLRAIDPLTAWQETGKVKIDNTIVLRSSKDSAKIVARVWSEGAPEDAKALSTLKLVRFISLWWWVGFLTFPRIVWEAQKLFFKRKLHVWYRPEIAASSIGRAPTDDEAQLEIFFRAFLESMVEKVEKPLRVIYEPVHSNGEEVVMYSPRFTYEEDHRQTLTIKVLSPAFYSRFMHYAHAQEAFDREALSSDEKNRTMLVLSPHLLTILLQAIQKSATTASQGLTPFDRARWSFLRRLRCPPPPPSYTDTAPDHLKYHVADIRTFRSSEMDEFVIANCPDADVYRRIVTKLFLAQQIAGGVPQVMSAIDLLVRACMIVLTIRRCQHRDAIDVFRPRLFSSADLVEFGFTLVLANGLHMWNTLKG